MGAAGVVRFILDDEVVALRDVDPTRTVLEVLREDLGRTGTKEGCAEGDCGACTVVLAEPDASGERLRYRAVNACIQFAPTLDGKRLLTVESLRGADGALHPVQRALVECHGSQCGFCTPGFVMSLLALYKSGNHPGRRAVDDALAGNLCRCTGYRPIVDAAERMYAIGAALTEPEADWLRAPGGRDGPERGEAEVIAAIEAIAREDTLALEHGGRRYLAPRRLDALAALAVEHPGACLLAGGTDVGLWVTKQHRRLDTVIHLGEVAELRRLEISDTHVEIGAAVTLTDAAPVLAAHYPPLGELMRRFASPPIRNAGTLGGNVANGSPIGDSMPALIALGATVVLRRAERVREMPLEDLYLDYQVSALEPGELLERVRVPLPAAGPPERELFATWKVSKRFDQDISAVCGAWRVRLDGDAVESARVAYGGMAATPRRALACERALEGARWSEGTVHAAMDALDADFSPIDDMRASAGYRRTVARNLLLRFYLASTGVEEAASLYDHGRHDHGQAGASA